MLQAGEHRFQTEIIERYRRRKSSVEESLIEMYLAGTLSSHVESITQTLWGTRLNLRTLSHIHESIWAMINKWCGRPIAQAFPYVYVNRIELKQSGGNEVQRVSVAVAVGISADGYRRVLGVAEKVRYDRLGWKSFLRYLKDRGLRNVDLFTSDDWPEFRAGLESVYPEAQWQYCIMHFQNRILNLVPHDLTGKVTEMLNSVHAADNRSAAREKAHQVVQTLAQMKLFHTAARLEALIEGTLAYYQYPRSDWETIRTSFYLDRILQEVKERTRDIGALPDDNLALMLVSARLRHIAATQWEPPRKPNAGLARTPPMGGYFAA